MSAKSEIKETELKEWTLDDIKDIDVHMYCQVCLHSVCITDKDGKKWVGLAGDSQLYSILYHQIQAMTPRVAFEKSELLHHIALSQRQSRFSLLQPPWKLHVEPFDYRVEYARELDAELTTAKEQLDKLLRDKAEFEKGVMRSWRAPSITNTFPLQLKKND
jgi:hypothetical protein